MFLYVWRQQYWIIVWYSGTQAFLKETVSLVVTSIYVGDPPFYDDSANYLQSTIVVIWPNSAIPRLWFSRPKSQTSKIGFVFVRSEMGWLPRLFRLSHLVINWIGIVNILSFPGQIDQHPGPILVRNLRLAYGWTSLNKIVESPELSLSNPVDTDDVVETDGHWFG